MTITIRPAVAADCVEIAEIYRYYVDNTVITFDYDSPTAAAWETKRAGIVARRWPFIVAVDSTDGAPGPDRVVGFAYLGDFRGKRAFDWTTEDTIYLHPDATGAGLGSMLLTALLTDLDTTAVRRVIAVIAESPASIRLHANAGFVESGTLHRVGFKHGRWVDCVFMEYDVPGVDGPPPV
ncbi:GNAT family N-acetyltransferase [Williamsia sp. CHRR-6]|uniref:GNAT family N-acetyltransferase n=1 Tax=Williamsia sp. CHRR-6 TaxID=2835871 RepID=UPI001BDAF353|nr:GNAT family N-acetyltransferase [Williamsia sp. CHRR-6]MBT0566680.1 N-acetyltransferase [Williamsia sp. CHRR-6]